MIPSSSTIRSVPRSEESQKLGNLVKTQSDSLISVSTVFPFKLFPTTISVDRQKIDVINRIFPGSENILSFMLADIAQVSITTSIFFASLSISLKMPPGKPYVVAYLPKDQAIRLQKVVEGLLVSKNEDVDMTQIPAPELSRALPKIGTAKV